MATGHERQAGLSLGEDGGGLRQRLLLARLPEALPGAKKQCRILAQKNKKKRGKAGRGRSGIALLRLRCIGDMGAFDQGRILREEGQADYGQAQKAEGKKKETGKEVAGVKTILEGPDGAGKTLYAKNALPAFKYFHSVLVPKNYRDVIRGISNDVRFLSRKIHDDSVLDRSFIISEYIYSRILRRTIYITEGFLKEFLENCRTKNVTIIVFLYKSPRRTACLTMKERDRHLPIRRINRLYSEIFLSLDYRNIFIRYIEKTLVKGEKDGNKNR